ncbi:hypothetical protein BGX27_011548, partial [Mortierella sp. AM989]
PLVQPQVLYRPPQQQQQQLPPQPMYAQPVYSSPIPQLVASSENNHGTDSVYFSKANRLHGSILAGFSRLRPSTTTTHTTVVHYGVAPPTAIHNRPPQHAHTHPTPQHVIYHHHGRPPQHQHHNQQPYEIQFDYQSLDQIGGALGGGGDAGGSNLYNSLFGSDQPQQDPSQGQDPLAGQGYDPLAGQGYDPLAGQGYDPLAGQDYSMGGFSGSDPFGNGGGIDLSGGGGSGIDLSGGGEGFTGEY